jgi:hypothetical protein
MMKDRRQAVRLLRIASAGLGALLLGVSLLADRLGLDSSKELGRGEILLIMFGLAFVLVGALGKRFVPAYRAAGTILLNTLVLLAALELASIAFSTLSRHTYREPLYWEHLGWEQLDRRLGNRPPEDAYWREHDSAVRQKYQPYVLWKSVPFHGEVINVDREGCRVTPGSNCGGDAFKVFTFGGSAMWGWGAPDSHTIPAFLQQELTRAFPKSLCVQNFAENAFVSTQSLIELALQLQQGNVPKIAIFYDGINDVFATYQSRRAGVHQQLQQIANSFEEKEHPLVKWIKDSELGMALQRHSALRSATQETPLKSAEESLELLAESIADSYLQNCQMVRALARQYGFEVFFFWQPHILSGHKKLTQKEKLIGSNMDPRLVDLCRLAYLRIQAASEKQEWLVFLGDLFDHVDGQTWIDPWGHVTPETNRMIARKIFDVLASADAFTTTSASSTRPHDQR